MNIRQNRVNKICIKEALRHVYMHCMYEKDFNHFKRIEGRNA